MYLIQFQVIQFFKILKCLSGTEISGTISVIFLNTDIISLTLLILSNYFISQTLILKGFGL